jgi:hypothetical protein
MEHHDRERVMLQMEYLYGRAMITFVEKLGVRDPALIPAFPTLPTDLGGPYVKVGPDGIWIIYVERGQEFNQQKFLSIDDALCELCTAQLSSLMYTWEKSYVHLGQMMRRHSFEKQLEVLAAVSPKWAERKRERAAERIRLLPDVGGIGMV